jgi:hypothetical protein
MKTLRNLLIAMLFAIPCAAEDVATVLETNVIEAQVPGAKGSVAFYSFTAGPGEVKLTIDLETNEYSTTADLELLRAEDLAPIGKESVMTRGTPSQQTVKSFVLPARQAVFLKITTRDDSTMKWVKYRIRIDGAELADAAMAPPAAPDLSSLPDMPAVPEAPSLPNVPNLPKAPNLLKSLLGGLPLPTTGMLRIEMKDGTVQQIDLKKVKNVSVRGAQ